MNVLTIIKTGTKWVTGNWQLALASLLIAAGIGCYVKYELTVAKLAKEVSKRQDAEARLDTLKVVLRGAAGRDSTVYYQRLATTYDTAVKSLRAQLKKAGTSAAVTSLSVAPRGVTATATDTLPFPGRPVVDSNRPRLLYQPADSTLTIAHHVDGPPADVDVSLGLRFVPDTLSPKLLADWNVRVQPRKIPITVDVGCRPDGAPDVVLRAPDWAPVEDAKTNAAEGLCARPPSAGKKILGLLEKIGLVGAGTVGGWAVFHH